MSQRISVLYGELVTDTAIHRAIPITSGIYDGMVPSVASNGAAWTVSLGTNPNTGVSIWRTLGTALQGRFTIYEDAPLTINIAAPSGQDRIDAIIGAHRWVQGPVDPATGYPTAVFTSDMQAIYGVVQGTPGTNPVVPSVPSPYDVNARTAIVLAYVRVPAGGGTPTVWTPSDSDQRQSALIKRDPLTGKLPLSLGGGIVASIAELKALTGISYGDTVLVKDYGIYTFQASTTFGNGGEARFNNPCGIAMDASGTLWVADSVNNTIRKITPAGIVTTFAGLAGMPGTVDGTGNAARFNFPSAIAVDTSGNLWVADRGNYTIRKITPAGVVTTFAGLAGTNGQIDGTGSAARFSAISSIDIDSSGNLWVIDLYAVRKITSAGVVTLFAGNYGLSGPDDGTGAAARFYGGGGIAVDMSGNLWVSECNTHNCIRKITPGAVVTTFVNTSGPFIYPYGIDVDAAGNLWVADYYCIRKVTPGAVVTTLAGTMYYNGSTDGTGATARFYTTHGISVDTSGNLWVTDNGNHTIRKITAGGEVTTFAGLAVTPGNFDSFAEPMLVNPTCGGGVWVYSEIALVHTSY